MAECEPELRRLVYSSRDMRFHSGKTCSARRSVDRPHDGFPRTGSARFRRSREHAARSLPVVSTDGIGFLAVEESGIIAENTDRRLCTRYGG